MQTMDPGQLKHRIQIQTNATTASSDLGQPIDAWTTVATVWGSIEPLSGREAFYAQQVQADASHKVIIRGNQTINTKQRLIHESRTFNIVSIMDDEEKKRWKTLMVTEAV
ncbi:head-tail adaptor protein [bacterium]|nr:head-tail adaptor protein [bacterium]